MRRPGPWTSISCSPAQLTGTPASCLTGGTLITDNAAVTPVAGTSTSTSNLDGGHAERDRYVVLAPASTQGDDDYPAATDASVGECFAVTDVASTTTAQKWLPNDTATVTAAGGSTVAGTVAFQLYESADCARHRRLHVRRDRGQWQRCRGERQHDLPDHRQDHLVEGNLHTSTNSVGSR